MTQPSFAKQIEKAHIVEGKLYADIDAAVIVGKHSRVSYHQKRYLNSFHSKLVATKKANSKIKKKYRQKQSPDDKNREGIRPLETV